MTSYQYLFISLNLAEKKQVQRGYIQVAYLFLNAMKTQQDYK